MDKLDYINAVIAAIIPIATKVIKLNIECYITITNSIEFHIPRQLSEPEIKNIEKDLKSKFDNWFIFPMSGTNKEGSYYYRFLSYTLERNAIKYNRLQGLNSLI